MTSELAEQQQPVWLKPVAYGHNRFMEVCVSHSMEAGSEPIVFMPGFGSDKPTIEQLILKFPHLPLAGFYIPFEDPSEQALEAATVEAPAKGVEVLNTHLNRNNEDPVDIISFSLDAGLIAIAAAAKPEKYANLDLIAPAGLTLNYFKKLARSRLKKNGKDTATVKDKDLNVGIELQTLLVMNHAAIKRRSRGIEQVEKIEKPAKDLGRLVINSEGRKAMLVYAAGYNIAPKLKQRIAWTAKNLKPDGSQHETNIFLLRSDTVFPLKETTRTLDYYCIEWMGINGEHPIATLPTGQDTFRLIAEARLETRRRKQEQIAQSLQALIYNPALE